MIATTGLTKRFGPVLAVDHVDLHVREGDRYGFLGPNGSGKTTVVRMLLGLVYATSGTIEVLGASVPRAYLHGAAADRRADRGSVRIRAPVRARQPDGGRRVGSASARRSQESQATDRRRAGPGRARRRRRPSGAQVLARHAPASRAGGRAAAVARGCSCSTSRPTAWTRRASGRSATCSRNSTRPARPSSCPAISWPRSSSYAARVGVIDRGKLVLQDDLSRAPRTNRPGTRAQPRRSASRGRP